MIFKHIAILGLLSLAAPAIAAGPSAEQRIKKLEAEVLELKGDLKQLRAAMAAAAMPKAPAASAAASEEKLDPAEEAYMLGYRLWEQRKLPEAQKALEAMAKRYPKHRRASYARNLAGRSYLAEGKPATAAQWFLHNRNTDPAGERVPDSLYYLGEALIQLNKPREA